ncbi:hypothetical protein JXJ21_11080 [candidate division KSB1 bacterium]|nr:hypothetical protein [candidate division KSB1 bacterium]
MILDIMLPKGDKPEYEKPSVWRNRGETILKKIKENWPETLIIVFTAKPADENEKYLTSLGADLYLEKPVTVSQFENTVLELLKKA